MPSPLSFYIDAMLTPTIPSSYKGGFCNRAAPFCARIFCDRKKAGRASRIQHPAVSVRLRNS